MSDENPNANFGAFVSLVMGIATIGGINVAPEMANAIVTVGMVVVGCMPSWVKMVRGK